jgi:hypothetical protein
MKELFSILTLYNADNTIFDNFMLPEVVQKDDVINNLLVELAELEVLYANPDTMKTLIGFWSKKELPVWNKLAATLNMDYNPLENLYRHEEYTDNETRNLAGTDNENRNLSGSDNETRNLAGTGTHKSITTGTTQNNGTDTQKEYVSGFNETTPTLAKQTEQTLGQGNSVNGTVDNTEGSTDTGTVDRATTENGTVDRATTDTGTVDKLQTAYMHGSIGVITPQQMIEQERRVDQFNIVNFIIDSFKGRFCILIY